jgi:hypothetical protein
VNRFFLPLALVALVLTTSLRAADAQPERELWLYYPTNLLPNENVDKLEPVWARAAKAGYTHVMIADSKFSRMGALGDLLPRYLKNIERTKAVAAKYNLKLVPAVFSIGYSNDLLSNDPNLVEGIPAKETPMVVKGGVARVETDASPAFGKPSFVDETVKLSGAEATVGPHEKVARFSYKLKTQPWRCYHVSVKVKTDGYTGNPEAKALAGGRQLQWENLGVKRTQDWTEHHVVFNSLDNEQVNFYFGVWDSAKGTLHWKDWRIEEVALLNVLRRPGCPLEAKTEDGKVLEEGKDFDPVADPKMGNDPYGGEFTSYHQPPTLKTQLPDGTKLRVSWYHPAVIYDGQISACIAEPKIDALLADQAKRMKAAWGDAAAGWMMSHDEFRTLGWCKACLDMHKTPGQQLADNVRKCTDLLKPAKTYVWNDMFDPFHNAVKGPYYLVNGPWTDAWNGLPSDVVIMNWNHGKRAESAKFFRDRGHKQIAATYYDQPDTLKQTKDWVETAKADPSIIGFMYTSWRNDYSKIEAFAELVAPSSR